MHDASNEITLFYAALMLCCIIGPWRSKKWARWVIGVSSVGNIIRGLSTQRVMLPVSQQTLSVIGWVCVIGPILIAIFTLARLWGNGASAHRA